MLARPRRNRKTPAIRSLCRETFLAPENFIMPFFVLKGENRLQKNTNLPGLSKYSADLIVKQAEQLHKKGVPAILLFAAEADKDPNGSEALSPQGAVPQAVHLLKQEIPSLAVFCDVALDPYTSHGHDGLIDSKGHVRNDETVQILTSMSILLADCGVDFIAPSDMMDGRVQAIRQALDIHGHQEVGILSYTAKYASSLYGPFRDTLQSTVQISDKKGYQMDPCNIREALREARLDEEEGADMLMVKPALFYLDVLSKIRQSTNLPLCAYQVSGEYAMILSAGAKNYLDIHKALLESLLCIKRAGADFLISYALPEILEYLPQLQSR